MKRVLLVVASLMLLTNSALRAEDSKLNPMVVGLYGGGQTGTDEGKANAAGFLMLREPINDYLSISFQVGDMYSPPKSGNVTGTVNILSYEFVPRLYIAPGWEQLNPPVWAAGIARPYLMAGAGYYNFNQSGSNLGSLSGTVGGVFGGGVDYLITPNIAAGIDVAYIYLRPDVNVAGFPQQTLNFDTLRLTAGIRIRLPQLFGKTQSPA